MKKKVYLIQANSVYGDDVKTVYLPYAVGCLAAYAWNDKSVSDCYELGRFIYTRENIDSAVKSMSEPFLVGFSCYVWNMEYNCRFAQKLKERFPNTIVLFGGHNVSPDGSNLDSMPFVDIVIHGEGEEPFRQLLLAYLNGNSIENVDNISYRKNGVSVTNPIKKHTDISYYPSPYLTGYFDDIVNKSGLITSAIWETNRGCPNKCAFCDWGNLKSNVRIFPYERIKAELEWFVKNKIEYVYCADANFGLFPRDTEIADLLIESNKKFGYPCIFKTNYTKNNDEVVFEISNKLISNRMGKSPTLSFQSLSAEVLTNIGRSNMQPEHFKDLMVKYSKAGIPVYSELILGLPGETYQSFTDGICKLLECNQHTCIGVYPCELLPNSLLGSKEYINNFGIKTVKAEFAQYHINRNNNDIQEYSDIVISTNNMNLSDWKKSFIFSVCVQALHNLGLTRALAIFLYYEKKIAYKQFYEDIIEWMYCCNENETVSGGIIKKITSVVESITLGLSPFSISHGSAENLEWSIEEYIFICLVEQLDKFYVELTEFMEKFGVEINIGNDLLNYQNQIIKKPYRSYMRAELKYDFYNYFKNIYNGNYTQLKKIENIIEVDDISYKSLDEYARINVWYGRRDDAQLYTGKRNIVKQIF